MFLLEGNNRTNRDAMSTLMQDAGTVFTLLPEKMQKSLTGRTLYSPLFLLLDFGQENLLRLANVCVCVWFIKVIKPFLAENVFHM